MYSNVEYGVELELGRKLARVADIAVEECAGVQAGERVAILTDSAGDPHLAELLAAAVRRHEAEAVIASFTAFSGDHDKVPARIDALMATSDVSLIASRSNFLYSEAMANAMAAGRVIYMAEVPSGVFFRPAVIDADYSELARLGGAFSEIVNGDRSLVVSSRAGTQASMMLKLGGAHVSSCRVREVGDRDYLPGGAWFACPVESSVNGVFVIDCSVDPGVAGGLVEEPIALTYADGKLVAVEGGSEAREFEAWLDSCDVDIRGFSHTGGGFNRKAVRSGFMQEDERILGSFNVSGGSNWVGFEKPGSNRSAYHFDGMILDATYSVDDVPICVDGEFTDRVLGLAAATSL